MYNCIWRNIGSIFRRKTTASCIVSVVFPMLTPTAKHRNKQTNKQTNTRIHVHIYALDSYCLTDTSYRSAFLPLYSVFFSSSLSISLPLSVCHSVSLSLSPCLSLSVTLSLSPIPSRHAFPYLSILSYILLCFSSCSYSPLLRLNVIIPFDFADNQRERPTVSRHYCRCLSPIR